MKDKALTERQREALGFVENFLRERGYPPSLRDICSALGIKGPKNARKHLEALERKGFLRRASNISRAIELTRREGLPAGGVLVPIAGRVRAGGPDLAIEDIAGYVALDEGFFGCSGAFLLRVQGESMTGAGIEDGDYVVIRPQRDASNGDIVVALIGDEATVKRFSISGGAIVLKPENPAMEPIVVEEGGPEFSIAGKVVSVIRRLKD